MLSLSVLWYVQYVTDVSLEGKIGHGQCHYEGLLTLKTAVCGLFIFHFREKYLGEQTSTRLCFHSKDALQWCGLSSCVCFSCWSAVSLCCEEQWLMGRYYHTYKKINNKKMFAMVLNEDHIYAPWYLHSTTMQIQDHEGKCQKCLLWPLVKKKYTYPYF